ncbi:MAG: MMPL family transporter [Chloroflexi bacterium]|nr:MMPL family transporter [Chloroflexota bacterium]MDA1003639.1 MMPL family transporter [Chloroflexota bacterium]
MIGAWLVALVIVMFAANAVGGVFTTDIEFTSNPESQAAKRLIEQVRGSEPLIETVIVRNDALTVDDPAFRAQVEAIVQQLRGMAEQLDPTTVASYYDTGIEQLVSADRHTTLVPMLLTGSLDDSPEKVNAIEAAIHGAAQPDFTVLMGGFASLNEAFTQAAEHDLSAESRVLPIAFVILVLVFGAVVAAMIPMAVAGVAIFIAFGLVTLISEQWPLSTFVQNMVLLIGLAVGIDYALFIVERFREERGKGHAVNDALGVAGDTATRAVLFSGVTVVIALMGLLIVPTNIFRSFGVGASIVVILSVAASLTMLPAILSLLGDRVNMLSIPLIGARRSHQHDTNSGAWAAIARAVMARPVISAVLSGGLLIVLAIPYFSIQLGASGPASIPPAYEVRQAFEILNEEFSAGRLAPTNIVVTATDVTAPAVQTPLAALVAALVADPDIEVISEPLVNAERSIAIFSVTVPGDTAGDRAIATMKRIRNEHVPATFGGADAQVLVGGQTALQSDFFHLVTVYTPIVFIFVLSFSFILLLLVFRSIVVPLKAIVMNLLSVGAAYGVLVAVFQKGWLAGPLGFQTVPEIEAWLPLFMFTVLFGLSMDYHVFLLSRIRERFDETHNNTESVAYGVRSTANIITGAAAIMVAVFSGFAFGSLVMFQQIGVGLAVAVFLDATVVRTVLVPSTMRLLGDRNWYLPTWLRWVPDLRVERNAPAPTPEPVAVR